VKVKNGDLVLFYGRHRLTTEKPILLASHTLSHIEKKQGGTSTSCLAQSCLIRTGSEQPTFRQRKSLMRTAVAFSVLCFVVISGWGFADEHVVSVGKDDIIPQWVHGDCRSTNIGPSAEPGKDGPARLHIKVKNGDVVRFTGHTVVFENGVDEQDKVWEIAEYFNGFKGKVGPLTDPQQKSFYPNPEKTLLTQLPGPADRAFFLIRIKNLAADRPIFFASGYSSHKVQPRGSKHVMFGAIVLEPEKQ
jgi:hypothetical protein